PSAASSRHSPHAFSSCQLPASARQTQPLSQPPVSAPIPQSPSTRASLLPPPYPNQLPILSSSSPVPSTSSTYPWTFCTSPQQHLTTNAALTNGAPFQPINPLIHQSINPLRSVRAITFDVGGTLIQPWPSVGHIYAEVAAHHGRRDISVEALNRQFAAAWKN